MHDPVVALSLSRSTPIPYESLSMLTLTLFPACLTPKTRFLRASASTKAYTKRILASTRLYDEKDESVTGDREADEMIARCFPLLHACLLVCTLGHFRRLVNSATTIDRPDIDEVSATLYMAGRKISGHNTWFGKN